MDPHRFDALTKVIAPFTTRRSLLALVTSLGLGTLGEAGASAKTSRKCKPACRECETCKKGDCRKKHGKKHCKKGKCQPKPPGTTCTAFAGGVCRNGACINLKTDEANCGTLGNACGATQVCQEGSCFPSSICPASIASTCTFSQSGTPCGPGCECGQSAEGNVVCAETALFCAPAASRCTSSASCAAGEACVDVSGCCNPPGPPLPAGTKTCMVRCPAPSA